MKKKIYLLLKLSFLLLTLSACELAEVEPPEDVATLDDKTVLNKTLDELVVMLKSINVYVNIKALPVIVAEDVDGSNFGECVSGNFIALDKNLFIDLESDKENLNSISLLWASLVHQIGECYFNRISSNEVVEPPLFYKFRVIKERGFPGRKMCRSFYYKDLPGSAMFENNSIAFFPDSLKIQYLKELVGADSVNNYRSYIRSESVSLVEDNESGDTDWRRCN